MSDQAEAMHNLQTTMRFPDVEADFDQLATTRGSFTTYVR